MEQTILSDIYEISDRFPNRVAVIDGDISLTYKELHSYSNQLAHLLQQSGVKSNDVVGICMNRSHQMMITIFAILKAGAAYLPLDLSYPDSRLQSIVDNSEITHIILEKDWCKSISFDGQIIYLDRISLNEYPISKPSVSILENDLAYVIYTSGSTGLPKGVAIQHRGLLNRIKWMQSDYPINEFDVIFFKTIYTFDVSVWEIFWAAMYGASLVLLPTGKEHDVKFISRSIQENNISVVHFVPSVFCLFLEYLEMKKDYFDMKTLKYVFTSGEKLTTSSVNSFNKLFLDKQAILINLYGPTEASIDVTHYAFIDKTINYSCAPIGTAINNIRLYVLDDNFQEIEDGAEGTLYIAGIGLAKEYYNNPQLTEQKFIIHPFIPNERIYDTGDLVTKEKSILHFKGRKDFQIKLRGLRIELSDIENNLTSITGIYDSVVIVNENQGNQLLHAFYKAKEQLSEQSIRQDLLGKLPPYMIPNTFIQLNEFPLTPSGKLDRKQLLEFI